MDPLQISSLELPPLELPPLELPYLSILRNILRSTKHLSEHQYQHYTHITNYNSIEYLVKKTPFLNLVYIYIYIISLT